MLQRGTSPDGVEARKDPEPAIHNTLTFKKQVCHFSASNLPVSPEAGEYIGLPQIRGLNEEAKFNCYYFYVQIQRFESYLVEKQFLSI